MKLYCLFFIRQGDSGEETGSVREHSAENHINVSNCTRNYNPLLQISAYLSHCCSSVLRVMNRKTSTATAYWLILGCFCVSLSLVLCLYRYEWQGKIEEDSEVLLVCFIQSQIFFQVKVTPNVV